MSLRAIVDQHYAGMNQADADAASTVLAEDVVTTAPGAPPMHGAAQFKPFAQAFIDAFPDAKVRAERVYESGDTILAEGVYAGTHTGSLVGNGMTVPPTGKRMELHFADLFKVRDGKVVEHNIYFDQAELMQQLGLMPG
jgi:steroid delta-isomerase-like uncharacterized protein